MASKTFDPTKFRNSLTKSITGMSAGFNDPTDWISTGSYALNYLISGDFHKGVPLGKVSVFAGESGAGKSYICSGNIIKDAQKQGIYVILVDSENALDESWLTALGVDTSEEKLLKLNMAMIDDVAKTISTFMKDYRDLSATDRPKVLFVIDSLGMLMTPTEINQFDAGDMKGDMGRKAKALKALVTNCVNMFGNANVGLVATNHTYASQDMFYSGLFDLFEKYGLLEKIGNRYQYITSEGEVMLEYRKNWTGSLLDRVMEDMPNKKISLVNIDEAEKEAELTHTEE